MKTFSLAFTLIGIASLATQLCAFPSWAFKVDHSISFEMRGTSGLMQNPLYTTVFSHRRRSPTLAQRLNLPENLRWESEVGAMNSSISCM